MIKMKITNRGDKMIATDYSGFVEYAHTNLYDNHGAFIPKPTTYNPSPYCHNLQSSLANLT